MHRLGIITILLLLLTGCRKTIDQVQEDKLMEVITNGRWKVTAFTKGNTIITADFAAYLFQFQANNTVDAYNNGTVEKTGMWKDDIAAYTITSTFANAQYPLTLLNGVWKISNTHLTFVEASQTSNGEVYTLRLDKQ
jgi:hypothetical protein